MTDNINPPTLEQLAALDGIYIILLEPVSYTHLDVYKRQALDHAEKTRDLVAARTHAQVTVRDKGYTLPPNWLPATRPRES